jgi:magnesium and cobalt transporter
MMEGAISVAELTVGDVMISRSQMVSLPVEAPFLDLMKQVVESGHSRFPVHGDNKDDILGILLAKDLLRGVVADNGPANIRELLRPAVLIPEAKKLNVLLKEFRLSRNHMAIVVDEYGGVAGLVTIEDVLEQIVGEIDDEHDEAEDHTSQIAIQADGQYVVDALTAIEDFNERFGATFPDDDYDTIGGLVTEAIGHLPETGDELTLDRFVFRVARADARRVQAFHVTVLPPDTHNED